MKHLERIAVFTIIDNIEHQLRGLKALLAAGSNEEKAKSIPIQNNQDSIYASDDDEISLEKEIEAMRQEQTKTLQKEAEAHFSNEWQKGLNG